MRRAEAYIAAGADILFYEAPADVDEMREIGRRFGADVPLLCNMVNGGVTPVMKPAELADLGFRIAIFPSAGFLAACGALQSVYGALRDTGDAEAGDIELFSFAEYNDLMGFNDILAFEERYGEAASS